MQFRCRGLCSAISGSRNFSLPLPTLPNVRIVFSDDAPEKQLQVDKETGQITITLKSPEGQSSPKEGYGLTAVMVNMGINEKI